MGDAREVTPGSPWRPLAGVPPLPAPVLAETLDGGQAFRWQNRADGTWQGVWGGNVVRLRQDAAGRIEWSAPAPLAAPVASALPEYFATGRDFAALTDSLPWRSDPHLARAVAAFPGLRLLRQPFGETLLGFLCSATKQIVQIKQMLALLAERHGVPLLGADSSPAPRGQISASALLRPQAAGPAGASLVAAGAGVGDPGHTGDAPGHRLPTWPELARIPEAELRACLLGFRARYIADTARFLAARPGWLEETEELPYADAKARLCALPGVGEKIADCVLLFGAGRFEAFPVDVWILKSLARHYGLADWKPAQVAHFGRAHFGPLAGFAQQFLFAWERHAARPATHHPPAPAQA